MSQLPTNTVFKVFKNYLNGKVNCELSEKKLKTGKEEERMRVGGRDGREFQRAGRGVLSSQQQKQEVS